MNPSDNQELSKLQSDKENRLEMELDNSRVPTIQESMPNTVQGQNIDRLLGGHPMPQYKPAGSAANYNPLNTETPANQNYWRGNLGTQPPTEGRGEGYVYKSDGEFIEQMKQERAQERLAEGSRAPLTEQRAATPITSTRPVMSPQPPTNAAIPAQPIVPTPASQGRASDTTISSGDFRDSAGTQK